MLLCGICMLLASTGTILLQAYELSQQFQLDISTAFTILYSASVGQVWIIRINNLFNHNWAHYCSLLIKKEKH